MASKQTQPTGLPFAEFLRTWWYLPITVWRDTFEDFYHPVFNFGCNIQDRDDENRVLDEVGSYGKQISQILKVVDVLVGRMREPLTAEERIAVDEFRSYQARVSAALAASRGPKPDDLSLGYVDRLEGALNTKRQSGDPQQFARLIEKLLIVAERSAQRAPAPAATAQPTTSGTQPDPEAGLLRFAAQVTEAAE